MNFVLWLRRALEGDWTKSILLCGPQNTQAERAFPALGAALITAAITAFSLFIGVALACLAPASPVHPVSHRVSPPKGLTRPITTPGHGNPGLRRFGFEGHISDAVSWGPAPGRSHGWRGPAFDRSYSSSRVLQSWG